MPTRRPAECGPEVGDRPITPWGSRSDRPASSDRALGAEAGRAHARLSRPGDAFVGRRRRKAAGRATLRLRSLCSPSIERGCASTTEGRYPVALPLRRTPAPPASPETHAPAHPGPGEDGHPLAVLALDERVPDGPLALAVHALDRRFQHLFQRWWQVLGQAHARDRTIGLPAPRNTHLRARQNDTLRALGRHVESLQATRQLPAAQRILRTKLCADATARRPATRKLLARENASDPVDSLGTLVVLCWRHLSGPPLEDAQVRIDRSD